MLDIIKNNTTYEGCLLALGLQLNNTNYKELKIIIGKEKIGKKDRRGIGGFTLDEFLKFLNTYSYGNINVILRKNLVKFELLEEKCYNCGIKEWNNKKAPLELHHIDGNTQNNKLDNFTFLCPNCHAQTENYRGGNVKNKYYT